MIIFALFNSVDEQSKSMSVNLMNNFFKKIFSSASFDEVMYNCCVLMKNCRFHTVFFDQSPMIVPQKKALNVSEEIQTK